MNNITSFEIHYTKATDKFFLKHENIRDQYEDAIKKIFKNDHPESIDIKRIKGKKSIYYRIRIGSYRVIFTIIDGKVVVVKTILAGSRGDVYKKL